MKKLLSILILFVFSILVTACDTNEVSKMIGTATIPKQVTTTENKKVTEENKKTTEASKNNTEERKQSETKKKEETCEHDGDFYCNKCKTELISDEELSSIFDDLFTNGLTLKLNNFSFESATPFQITEYSFKDFELYLKPEINGDDINLNGYLYGIENISIYFSSETGDFELSNTQKNTIEAVIENNEFNLVNDSIYKTDSYEIPSTMYMNADIDEIIEFAVKSGEISSGQPVIFQMIELYGEDILEKANEALLPLLKKASVGDTHEAMLIVKKFLNILFNVEKTETGYEISLNYDGFNATLDKVKDMKISEVIDYILGEGTTKDIKDTLLKTVGMTVEDAINYFESKAGFTVLELEDAVDDIMAVISPYYNCDAFVAQFTGNSYQSLEDLLKDKNILSLKVVDVVGPFIYGSNTIESDGETVIETPNEIDYVNDLTQMINQYYEYATTNPLPLDEQTIEYVKGYVNQFKEMIKLSVNLDANFKFEDLSLNVMIPEAINFEFTAETGKVLVHDYKDVKATCELKTDYDPEEAFESYFSELEGYEKTEEGYISTKNYENNYYIDYNEKTIYVNMEVINKESYLFVDTDVKLVSTQDGNDYYMLYVIQSNDVSLGKIYTHGTGGEKIEVTGTEYEEIYDILFETYFEGQCYSYLNTIPVPAK